MESIAYSMADKGDFSLSELSVRIIKGHPLVDGNKRLGILTMLF